MASSFCHGFGVTKQVRLERIVSLASHGPEERGKECRDHEKQPRQREKQCKDPVPVPDVLCAKERANGNWNGEAEEDRSYDSRDAPAPPKRIFNARPASGELK